ncbi:uncharacterized protein F4812DRAFT_411229 [Daldinia caldariorum]|uniref:uncharacterized protein n=1 Tax=Daldinia caldariorum TaxID=326644 RepID=UPI002008B9E6|nr:uncharacterized protein F4812DRAFT_411229 [Daldinia caldariorum]KAI1473003.1 hypothetical protein F4812DRAFT_411229 [Daldinia caldariorum]
MSSTRTNAKEKPLEHTSAPTNSFVSTLIPDSVREANIRMDKMSEAIAKSIAKTEQRQDQLDARLSNMEPLMEEMANIGKKLATRMKQRENNLEMEPKQQPKTSSLVTSLALTVIKANDPDPRAFFEAPLNSPPPHVARRLADGRFNLDIPYLELLARTPQERYVMTAWPSVALPARVEKFQGSCQDTNRVEIPAKLRLLWADDTALDKLDEIQRVLQRALVPYNRWPMRVALEMEADFKTIAMFIQNWNPDWVTVVEAILQVLANHHVIPLRHPVMEGM